ncbi:Arsenite methyltransferase methyltransferase [Venustampulla echinocandica]|uniref:Arsenite methyltransferase n=1 Tax=Venustampulla echinocandica TaxID=2656787 RepID=A0A370TX31_9HELO|nr:Arsenite methyltransferase methyltransferase [Venustampulla echinocandica]RDL40079.1 Arsenite methyltransferase methyltransferase [Venustampulla echinocandica]
MDSAHIYQQVQDHYGSAANSGDAKYSTSVAKSFGYSEEELANIPQEANLGLSCGNPLVIASLSEGETVIDLGSGAGLDVFLAAKKVGSSGRVIGVDMNKEMLARAEKNKQNSGADNVKFVESQITKINLESGIADCIISNCVVNLVPEAEKPLVFKEIFRLLKSGGRLAISDILAKKPLPDKIVQDMSLYVGCVAGASQVSGYEKYLREAGFDSFRIVDTNSDLNVYMDMLEEPSCGGDKQPVGCCANISDGKKKTVVAAGTPRDINLNEWAASYKIFAVKP